MIDYTSDIDQTMIDDFRSKGDDLVSDLCADDVCIIHQAGYQKQKEYF